MALINSLALGGGTANIQLSDVFAEACAIPIIIVASLQLQDVPWSSALKAAIAVYCAILLLPLLQLIPLPPPIWTNFPGRDWVAHGFSLAGVDLPWMPISLSPTATRQSAFSLLPAFSVFLATVNLDLSQRRVATAWLIGFAVISVALGLLQMTDGSLSSLRFYYWDTNELDGFFANRNHLGSLLYVGVLLAASWGMSAALRSRDVSDSRSWDDSPAGLGRFGVLTALAGSLGAMVLGLALTQSRAAIGLGLISVLCSFVIALQGVRLSSAVKLAGAAILAVAVPFLFGLDRVYLAFVQHFGQGVEDSTRAAIAAGTKALIAKYFPVGAGFGSFVPVFAADENVASSLGPVVNRAHNDFLEWTLEGGAFAWGVGVGAGIYLLRMIAVAWIGGSCRARVDVALRRAYAVVPIVLLAHSVVDYPLRTIALMGVFALSVGMLIDPPENRHDAHLRLVKLR